MTDEQDSHFTLWTIGSQQIQLTFEGGRIVSDAGLLAVRALEKPLGVIAELAPRPAIPQVHRALRRSSPHPGRLPDPRRLSGLQRRPGTPQRPAVPDPGR